MYYLKTQVSENCLQLLILYSCLTWGQRIFCWLASLLVLPPFEIVELWPVACVVVSLLVVLLFLEMILRPQQQLGLGLELLGTFPEDIKSTVKFN